MFQDENENPTPYTKNYDHEAAAQTRDAGTYAVMGQPATRNPEQHDSPVAQNSGHYPVSTQPDYTPRATGSYAAPTQQDYYPQGTRNYPPQPQPNYGSPASSPTYRNYPAPGQPAYPSGPSGNYPGPSGNYPAQTQQGYVPQTPKKPGGMRTGAIMALTLVIILIFGIGIYAGSQFGGMTTTTANSSTATKVTTIPDISTVQGQQEAAIAIIEPSVVELDVTTSQGEDIGSGVIIDKNGDIITNNHVVNGGQTIKIVLSNGKIETAQLIGTSAANDLAIVRIQPFANMTVATIGDSSKLIVGQEVLAVGNPLGITQTATRGIVSALNRSIQESAGTGSTGVTITGAIQTDAPINPGNSGGALINLQGQLVGIPTLTAVNTESNTDANGIGFAIPASTVQTVIAQILNK